MKLTVSKGSTNFTLEFEEKELSNVSKNIGTIMTNALGSGTQQELKLEPINAVIKEEEAVKESLKKLEEKTDESTEILADAVSKTISEQAESDLEAQRAAKAKADAEEKDRLEAEALAKAEEERIAKEKEEAIAAYNIELEKAKTMQKRADEEIDADIKSILQSKADTASEKAMEMLIEIEEKYGKIEEAPLKEEKAKESEEEVEVKENEAQEKTSEETAPAQDETKESEEDEIVKKGNKIIQDLADKKINSSEMTRALMNLGKGSKAERLLWVIKTFPQKEQYWRLMTENKSVFKSAAGFSNKEINEFKELVKNGIPF